MYCYIVHIISNASKMIFSMSDGHLFC